MHIRNMRLKNRDKVFYIKLKDKRRNIGMKSKMNYNYAFVFYDVNEKRVNKVFKVCKKYLSHFQKSVFRGEITPANLINLRKDLNKVIEKDEDFICIVKLLNGNVFREEVLGIQEVINGETLIL